MTQHSTEKTSCPDMAHQFTPLPRIISEAHPEWETLYSVAMRMAIANIDTSELPGWLPQMTCMPGLGYTWQWDSCFMTLYARYSNGILPGMNNLDNLYRLQRKDGYISMAYNMQANQEAYGERVNPPLYAWAEWEYFQVTGDDTRFARVLPILIRYFDWLKANRRRDASDLYWFEDSGSSGMDNAPRSGYQAAHLDGSDICHIDLACQQVLAARCLAAMAAHQGDAALAARMRDEGRQLAECINAHHWCERTGFYYDLFARSSRGQRMNFVNHKTVASFWPIVSGVASDAQVARLVEHLQDPAEFATRHPVPTLSKDDPNYSPYGDYWLGGVWAPANYMIVNGLEERGWHALAREIAVKHLEAMVAVWQNEEYRSIWEAYAPEYDQPSVRKEGRCLVRKDFVGWSGLGPIAMLIEQIFGIHGHADAQRISWDLRTEGTHGVEGLRLLGRTLTLLCDGVGDAGETMLSISTDAPVTLRLSVRGERAQTVTLNAGTHALRL